MFKSVVLCIAVLSSGAAGLQGQITAITGARIVDGLGGPPIENGVLVIRGDRIEAVGEVGSVAIPPDADVIEAEGRTVIPGLADMHVHLVGGWDGQTTDVLGFQRYLNSLLYAGVTTAQDVGGVLLLTQQMRQEIEAGRIAGPRLRFVGPLLDGAAPVWPPISYRITALDQVELTVQQLAQGGVDALKVYGTLPDSLVRAVVEAAASHDLPVIADLGARNGSRAAAESGIRAFAHAGSAAISEGVVSYMAENEVGAITTLAVIESFARHRFDDLSFLDHPLLARTLPPWFREDILAHGSRELSDQEQGMARFAAVGLENGKSNVQRLHEAGALLVAGTDSPYPGVYYGEGLHRELELLVEAGLTPLEALTAATRNAARLLGEEDEWGTLAPGLAADLVLLRGAPDRDISDTRNIELVMQGGRVIDRAALEFDLETDGGYRAARPLQTPF